MSKSVLVLDVYILTIALGFICITHFYNDNRNFVIYKLLTIHNALYLETIFLLF